MPNTPTTSVPQRGQDRRAAVIEAAAVEFDRLGYSATSLAGIGQAAAVSQGAIHFHFRTKQAIALAVIDEQNARTAAAIDYEDPSPTSGLIAVSRAVADLLLTDPVVRSGIRLSLENRVFAGTTSSFYDQWIAAVSDLLRLAVAAGELNTTLTADELGASLVPYFTGVQLVSDVRTGRADLLPAAATMWRVLLLATACPDHRDRLLAVVDRVFG